ncbi:hypothetical protein C1H46_042989 [Malus baccata]|uniref:Uncharacterized protein n=1 Tax=Malus baccata TaxID=106549 RepID=A0A540KB61_MALBA|nr:hypothetical protein C1H46_042989 [Malus baccata]
MKSEMQRAARRRAAENSGKDSGQIFAVLTRPRPFCYIFRLSRPRFQDCCNEIQRNAVSTESSTVDVTRFDFPADFVLGVTTDAPQYEGATDVAGKVPSVWDNYIEKFRERIQDHSNLSTATDSHRRYKVSEDILIIKFHSTKSFLGIQQG